MKGLLLKDLLEMRLKMKMTFVFLLFYSVFTVICFKSLTSFVVVMALYSITFPLTSIALDERSRWNIYVLATPLRPRDYVLEKYVFSLLTMLCAFAIELIVCAIFGRTELASLVPFALVMLGSTLIFSAVTLPCALILGTEKARYIMLGLFILPTALIMYFSNSGALPKPANFDEAAILSFISVAVPLAGAALFALSYPVALLRLKRDPANLA